MPSTPISPRSRRSGQGSSAPSWAQCPAPRRRHRSKWRRRLRPGRMPRAGARGRRRTTAGRDPGRRPLGASASLELIQSLLRRPADAPALLALRSLPAWRRPWPRPGVERVPLGPLDREARPSCSGARPDRGSWWRSQTRRGQPAGAALANPPSQTASTREKEGSVPAGIAASVAEELAALPADAPGDDPRGGRGRRPVRTRRRRRRPRHRSGDAGRAARRRPGRPTELPASLRLPASAPLAASAPRRTRIASQQLRRPRSPRAVPATARAHHVGAPPAGETRGRSPLEAGMASASRARPSRRAGSARRSTVPAAEVTQQVSVHHPGAGSCGQLGPCREVLLEAIRADQRTTPTRA